MGITTAIGIGGDPIIGTTTKEAVALLMEDPETEAIVMIGEIGGQLEADAAQWVKENGNKKPVVGFIAGETAPKGMAYTFKNKANKSWDFRIIVENLASCIVWIRTSFSFMLSKDFSKFSAPFWESVVRFPILFIKS